MVKQGSLLAMLAIGCAGPSIEAGWIIVQRRDLPLECQNELQGSKRTLVIVDCPECGGLVDWEHRSRDSRIAAVFSPTKYFEYVAEVIGSSAAVSTIGGRCLDKLAKFPSTFLVEEAP
jgi:hypothetical protein